MLRRADRGLLMAKAKGRNVVVQLGVGSGGEEGTDSDAAPNPETVVERAMVTPVPISVAIEKLRGFVADHQAEVESAEGDKVRLRIDIQDPEARRRADRLIQFTVDLRLEEELLQRATRSEYALGSISRTRIFVGVSPKTDRDRRRSNSQTYCQQILKSLRSYLMATTEE